eukprot:TRINITY_DN30700_c0_g1_i1.p2 TRINITY_DN30700_c0_g1~~TRINITY_DN30700_c0_g1_i1.p2  ORF type:complete len:111 (-),score=24.95 TRINITY_DN30700_c0_g1_i1:102-434(-)
MEAYFGKWKLNHEDSEGMEEFMDAQDMPEMFKEKMKDIEAFYYLEEVADEPGKYDWKWSLVKSLQWMNSLNLAWSIVSATNARRGSHIYFQHFPRWNSDEQTPGKMVTRL